LKDFLIFAGSFWVVSLHLQFLSQAGAAFFVQVHSFFEFLSHLQSFCTVFTAAAVFCFAALGEEFCTAANVHTAKASVKKVNVNFFITSSVITVIL
jgi:hypothetical protein